MIELDKIFTREDIRLLVKYASGVDILDEDLDEASIHSTKPKDFDELNNTRKALYVMDHGSSMARMEIPIGIDGQQGMKVVVRDNGEVTYRNWGDVSFPLDDPQNAYALVLRKFAQAFDPEAHEVKAIVQHSLILAGYILSTRDGIIKANGPDGRTITFTIPQPEEEDGSSECVLHTILDDQTGSGDYDDIPVRVVVGGGALLIKPQGYGVHCAPEGEGTPVVLEQYEGRLRVVAWSDINSDNAQVVIDLEDARELLREEE